MNPGPTLETPRLILRPHRLEDLDACHFLATDRDALRLTPHRVPSREETWHRLLGMIGHWTMLDYGLLLVQERLTSRVVGEVGFADSLRGLGPDFDSWPELSWMITSDVQGHGYATEAAQAMHLWMESSFSTERTVCLVDPRHALALHTAEKLGYHSFGKDQYRGGTVIKLRRFLSHG